MKNLEYWYKIIAQQIWVINNIETFFVYFQMNNGNSINRFIFRSYFIRIYILTIASLIAPRSIFAFPQVPWKSSVPNDQTDTPWRFFAWAYFTWNNFNSYITNTCWSVDYKNSSSRVDGPQYVFDAQKKPTQSIWVVVSWHGRLF